MPHIPIIEDLTSGPVPPGSNILVEYEPTSQWYNTHMTMAAGWLKTGGVVNYHVSAQPRETVRSQLSRLGVDVGQLEAGDINAGRRLVINDWYTATLGRTPEDAATGVESLKVADLSIIWGKGEKETEISFKAAPPKSPLLRIVDNASCLARFNEERAWIEFVFTRLIPRAQKWGQITIVGFTKGVHSERIYKMLEAGVDGVIDFKLEEVGKGTKDLVRITSLRNVGYDRLWHTLKIGDDFTVALES